MPEIDYYVADGFYAKKKVIDGVLSKQKHLVSKLRPNANLFYLLDRDENPNVHGNRKYESRVIKFG